MGFEAPRPAAKKKSIGREGGRSGAALTRCARLSWSASREKATASGMSERPSWVHTGYPGKKEGLCWKKEIAAPFEPDRQEGVIAVTDFV